MPALLTFALSSQQAVEDDRPREVSNHLKGGEQNDQKSQLSFEELFRYYAPYILHALPFLGVAEADTDDLCQEIFLTVHQKLATFEGRSTLKTWIYGICLRKVSNYRKRAHRRFEYASEKIMDHADRAVQTEQDRHIQQDQQREILEQALASLSEKKRAVFVLFEIEELGMEEVAAIVGCPPFTAYARLYAARRDVKKTVRRMLNTRSTERLSS